MLPPANPRVALIADDEPFARLFILQVLLDQRFTVLEAEHAAEALEMLKDNSDIELLVTDINMPGTRNGLVLARRARTLRPDLGIIIASGAPKPEGLQEAFIAKPYSVAQLLSVVAEVTGVSARVEQVLEMTMLGQSAPHNHP